MLKTNEELTIMFHSQQWHSRIGGLLGIHRDIVPYIISSPHVAGPVDGVPYIESFMDNSTPNIYRGDYNMTLNFLTYTQNGTWIEQKRYQTIPFQKVVEVIWRWIKINPEQWEETVAHKYKYHEGAPLFSGSKVPQHDDPLVYPNKFKRFI